MCSLELSSQEAPSVNPQQDQGPTATPRKTRDQPLPSRQRQVHWGWAKCEWEFQIAPCKAV